MNENCSVIEQNFPDVLTVPNSCKDHIANQLMKDSIQMRNGHFELPLLWKNKDAKLPNNRSLAENRDESLRNRLNKNEGLRTKYTEVMKCASF